MNSARAFKDSLYEQVARLAKALASPKRLELIELLCQGEKSVEQLAAAAGITVKLASAHLKELRHAHLVTARRQGKHAIYRVLDNQVADLWVALRTGAEARFGELRSALEEVVANPHQLAPVTGKALLQQARKGEVTVIDVRPADEYDTAHLPYARSVPLDELQQRLGEIPTGRPVVAYCRGPFCLMARDAVELLNRKGFKAVRLDEGIAEWRARGLPLAH